jgi:short-subunit dehydrogenase
MNKMKASGSTRHPSGAPWRTALVTGASVGIGEALALELARRGVSVGLLARRNDLLADLARRLADLAPAGRFPLRAASVADVEALPDTLDALWLELGGVDLFIANAGVGRATPAFSLVNLPALQETLAINVTGALVGLEHMKNRMLERESGHLAGISSLAGVRGLPGSSVYCASKAALTTYLEALAVELAPHGIHVSNVRPGYVRTAMTDANTRMPFLMEADVAARVILAGLERRHFDIAFPRSSALFMNLLGRLPRALYFPLARAVAARLPRGDDK